MAIYLPIQGEANAQWASEFASPGPDGPVRAMVMNVEDGQDVLYAGGEFLSVDGTFINRIARLENGVWEPLGAGVNSVVTAVTIYREQLIAAGFFTEAGGKPVGRIARWDGQEWHALGSGLNATVLSLAVYGDRLIAGGAFSMAGGVLVNHAAAWDGTSWHDLGGGLNSSVEALHVHEGDLIAGGHFSSAGGNPATKVARWNGVSWQPIGNGLSGSRVISMTTYQRNLIAVGRITPTSGNTMYAVTQWDGNEWSLVGDGLMTNPSESVPLTAVVFNGKLAVAGRMPNVPTGLALWDGNTWSTHPTGVSTDIGEFGVNTVLVDTSGELESLLFGGTFTAGGEVGANNLVRLSDGTWSRLSECPTCLGLSGPVAAITSYDDGTGEAIYVAGYARFAGTQRINRIAKWNGTSWSALGGGLDNTGFALEVFDDGSGSGEELYVGGSFANAGDTPANRMAKWNGRSWSAVGAGIDTGAVFSLKSFDDGTGPQLYAGGTFSAVSGNPAIRLARWNGKKWTAVDGIATSSPSGSATVLGLDVWNDGVANALVVAGRFRLSDAPQAVHIATWRNAQWSMVGGSITSALQNEAVQAVAVSPKSGSLFAFGKFAQIGSTLVHNLARWDGVNWHPIPPPASTEMSGSKVIVHHTGDCERLFTYNTGTFGLGSPFPPGLVYLWNGERWQLAGGGLFSASGSAWAFPQLGGHAHAIAAFHLDGDRLCVGGTFSKSEDTPTYNFAIWNINGAFSCGGDIDNNDVVDSTDLFAVISAWGVCENCPADPSPCGGDGVVNVSDLLTVISQWGPCP